MNNATVKRTTQVEEQIDALSREVDLLGDRILTLKSVLEDGGYLTQEGVPLSESAPVPMPTLVDKAHRIRVNHIQLTSMRDCVDSIIQRFEG